jgi:hypothetical protein
MWLAYLLPRDEDRSAFSWRHHVRSNTPHVYIYRVDRNSMDAFSLSNRRWVEEADLVCGKLYLSV